MVPYRSAFVLATSLLLVPGLIERAEANFVTFDVPTTPAQRTTDFSTSLTMPAFDKTLGTLQDVVISMTDSGNFHGSLTNTSATAQSFMVTEETHLTLALGSTVILSDQLNASQSYISLAVNVIAPYGAYNPTSSVGPTTYTSGTVFDAFASSTTGVVLAFSTATDTITQGGGGNVDNTIFTTAGAVVTVRYDYIPAGSPGSGGESGNGDVAVPEPASLLLTTLGGMLGVAVRLARRRPIAPAD